MTGPDHYQVAEGLLDDADPSNVGDATRAEMIARAQVHATLAVAAAMGGDWKPEDDDGR